MALMKEMQFPVTLRWRGGKEAFAAAHDDVLRLATPPEFRDGLAGDWSPEDLLVAAAASCFVLTLVAVAERHDAVLLDVTVTATGHMSRRNDGRFGFTVIEIDAELETLPGGVDAVRAAAAAAEDRCLVTMALDVPVHLGVHVRTLEPEREPA